MSLRDLMPFGGSNLAADPFTALQREMNRMFDDAFRSAGSGQAGGAGLLAPRLDVHESEREFSITVDLPGVGESDLDLQLEGDVLTIRGEKKHQRERDERGYHVVERSSGTFLRSLRLPFEPDPNKVSAECRDGVLTVTVPKEGAQQRTRRIAVNRGGSAGPQPSGRTLEGSADAANDQRQPDLQQAASQQGTNQAGGANDASGAQANAQQSSSHGNR